jgi:VanZ family protein
VWPTLSRAQEDGPAVRQVALVYLFAALYGLFHVLVSLYVPGSRGTRARRWIAGLIGAIQAGTLATLAVLLLPYA